MKIKNLLYTGLISSTLLLGTSCSEDFTDTRPTSDVSEADLFSSAENLMVAINGMHRNMYVRQNGSQGNNGYTAQMIINDAMGEDLVFAATGPNWFVSEIRWNHTNNDNSTTTSYPWNFWYSMIKNANMVIQLGAPLDGDAELKASAIGQAHAYRAFGLFQLVQTYSKAYNESSAASDLGVVIRTDPYDNNPKARSSVKETYDQIWADLNAAEEMLDGIDMYNKSHISVETVKGMMARVALVQKNYTVAAEKAREAREGFNLMSNAAYKTGFNDYNNSEWMWGISIISDQTDYFGNFHAYMSRNFNSSQIRSAPKKMNEKLFRAFPNNDVRKQVVDSTGLHTNLGLPSNYSKFPFTSQKFLAQAISSPLGDVPFMRSAEMYLIEAEALYYTDEAASKAVLEELIRNRRNDNAFTVATSGPQYLEEILLNRRIELWGEGFRFHDLKRLGLGLNRTDTGQVTAVVSQTIIIPPTDNRWQWLIPRQEINSNSLLVQNPI